MPTDTRAGLGQEREERCSRGGRGMAAGVRGAGGAPWGAAVWAVCGEVFSGGVCGLWELCVFSGGGC